MSNVSLKSQISAVELAISHAGRSGLPKAQQELQQSHLAGALKTLRWLQQNEAEIKAKLETRGASQ